MNKTILIFLTMIIALFSFLAWAQVYEVSGSPFATEGAPLPAFFKTTEKLILIDPQEHVWGAYRSNGKLLRWGIASAGANACRENGKPCRTQHGTFRIYSIGNENCISHKYDDAPMPYCMYFNGNQALHGSNEVEFENISHGCVRIHIDDAKWLHDNFVEAPKAVNHFRGTVIIVKSYD